MARHKNCYFYHGAYTSWQISSVQFSRSVMSDSLWPHELKHTRLPCPSPTSGVYSNSCPLSWWCHPTISSSVGPFSWLISVRNIWNTVSLENWWCIRCGWLEILYRYLSLVWTGYKNLAKKKCMWSTIQCKFCFHPGLPGSKVMREEMYSSHLPIIFGSIMLAC